MKRRSVLVKVPVLVALAQSKRMGPVALAHACHHENHSYMSRLLRGQPNARRVTMRTAERLMETLGVEFDALFEAEEVKSLDSTKVSVPRPRRAA